MNDSTIILLGLFSIGLIVILLSPGIGGPKRKEQSHYNPPPTMEPEPPNPPPPPPSSPRWRTAHKSVCPDCERAKKRWGEELED